ncbi:fibronectin type III domain-containing protein [Patescibacteria group bacterium]|nr:fibronectin type III domain-containing protein [Patescibacteria group bacterium]MBU1931590.1 fibronectin type III domain-containing protein [Patescibacteria group bacterium]
MPAKKTISKKTVWVGFSLVGIVFLSGSVLSYRQRPSPQPENVQIANQQEKSLTISWVTAEPQKGCLVFTSQSQPFLRCLSFSSNRFLPDFIASGKSCDGRRPESNNHHVTLTDLKPETEYFYQILSGNQAYNDQLYSLDTKIYTQERQSIQPLPPAKTIKEKKYKSSSPLPVYGNVLTPTGEPAAYVTVYLDSLRAANRLSALTDQTGAYAFDLTVFYADQFELVGFNQSSLLIIQINKQSQVFRFGESTPAPDFRLK